jgi:hypothetical protein
MRAPAIEALATRFAFARSGQAGSVRRTDEDQRSVAAPGWQGGEARLYPQRYSEPMTTPPAGMPRGSTSGGLADRTYGGVNPPRLGGRAIERSRLASLSLAPVLITPEAAAASSRRENDAALATCFGSRVQNTPV